MKKKLLPIAAALIAASSLEACTGIKLFAKNGTVVHGRTVEFGIDLDPSIVVIPRNYPFTGTTPLGPGISYVTRYGAVGVTACNQLAIVDGINEKGLAVGTFHFPGYAEYAEVHADNQCVALSPLEFPHWILTQFATIEEVRAGLTGIAIAPTITPQWGAAPPPFHYIVFDKQGKCLVIEPIKGQLVVYENKLGVLTNDPPFSWHMNYLRNFIHLSPPQAKPLKLNAFDLVPIRQGTEINAIPGDLTPASRFVRAALLCMNANSSDSAESAVYQAFHLLNQFDIPTGLAEAEKKPSAHTCITCVRDPHSLKYYFKTYDDQSIRVIDLQQFDLDESAIKRIRTAETNQPCSAADISSELE